MAQSVEPHTFRNKGKASVCIHCGKTEADAQKAPRSICKVATGKVNAGRLKPTRYGSGN